MAALSRANLVRGVGFTEAANSASLELLVATDEFLGMVGTILKGVELTSETLALNVMEQVGAGGSYLWRNIQSIISARTGSPSC